MALEISNTLTRTKEPFVPIEGGKVRMYICGPTVYSDAHIGHAMFAIVFDVVRRYLEYSGFEVAHAQNFTDVDDKIIDRAAKLGIEPEALANQMIEDWLVQARQLNILPPTLAPRATQEIGTIIDMIQHLIDNGFAYPVESGDVFYRVRAFADYGKLSHRQTDDLLAGARIDVDPLKEDPLDFALWKAAKPGEPSWPSPWGEGRPGWHIECSAMIFRHLGGQIDIHGGGADLIFPHHENEIAQSEAFLHASPFVRYWMHNGLLHLGGEKMSKSIGNLITIKELLANGQGQTFRFLVLSSHYRSPLTFNDEAMASADGGLNRLRNAVRDFDPSQVTGDPPAAISEAITSAEGAFKEAMDDDFNTPLALAALFELARQTNRVGSGPDGQNAAMYGKAALLRLAGVLGLILNQPEAVATPAAPFIDLLLEVRNRLREQRNWSLADQIRDRLTQLGVTVEDTAGGSSWRQGHGS